MSELLQKIFIFIGIPIISIIIIIIKMKFDENAQDEIDAYSISFILSLIPFINLFVICIVVFLLSRDIIKNLLLKIMEKNKIKEKTELEKYKLLKKYLIQMKIVKNNNDIEYIISNMKISEKLTSSNERSIF